MVSGAVIFAWTTLVVATVAGSSSEESRVLAHWRGSKLLLLYSGKEGCSMSRDMLKLLQNDTGHPKKRYPKTIPPRPAKRYGAP